MADQQALSHSSHQGSLLIHSAEKTAGKRTFDYKMKQTSSERVL